MQGWQPCCCKVWYNCATPLPLAAAAAIVYQYKYKKHLPACIRMKHHNSTPLPSSTALFLTSLSVPTELSRHVDSLLDCHGHLLRGNSQLKQTYVRHFVLNGCRKTYLAGDLMAVLEVHPFCRYYCSLWLRRCRDDYGVMGVEK